MPRGGRPTWKGLQREFVTFEPGGGDPSSERRRSEARRRRNSASQSSHLHAPINGGCTCNRDDCGSPGKHPLWRDWPEKGISDPTKVDGLWLGTNLGVRREGGLGVPIGPRTSPNIGILTGGASNLLVLDVDPRNGGDETLFDLERVHGPLPETAQVITGSGGSHYYFVLDEGVMVPSVTFGQGLDIKSHRGFVVAPGSVHGNGLTYEWEVEHHPDDVAVAPAPAWLFKKACTPRSPYPRAAKRRHKATKDQREDFVRLWAAVGLSVDPERESTYLCVFHPEKTPSLHIDPSTAIWYCFGCGAGGGLRDLCDLLMSPQGVIERPITTCGDIRTKPLVPDPKSWPRPELPTARCGGIGQLHEHREDRGRHRAIHPLCGRWQCSVCGPYVKTMWISALHGYIFAGQGMLHIALVDPEEWPAAKRRIERHDAPNADFMRFDFRGVDTTLESTPYVVITTAPEGLEINRGDANRLVSALVEALPFDQKRIETSASWEKIRRVTPKSGKWDAKRTDLGPDLSWLADYVEMWGVRGGQAGPIQKVDGEVWGEGVGFRVPPEIREENHYHWMMQAMHPPAEDRTAS